MADIIQLRGDTGINWLTVDPILADRELGFETDTGKIKFGDGSLKWSLLAYRGLVGADGDFYEQRYQIAELQPETPTEREPVSWLIDPPSRLPDQQLWVIRAKIDGASGLLESAWSIPVLWASTGFLPTWETLETETAPSLGSMDHTVYISISGLSIPLPVGTISNQKLTLCNISTGKIFITGSGDPLELDEGKSLIYLWYAGEWVQLGSVGGSGDGDSGAVVGDFKYTIDEEEKNGWKNFVYKKMSQTLYGELWGKAGHGFAKNAADAAEAEAEGMFWLGDGQFLFARIGQSWPLVSTGIDISTDRITLAAHGLKTDGSQNGRPIKLMRVPGQTPTMPTGSGFTEYDQNYLRVIDANTLELYDTEANAIATGATTGRVNWSSAGSGIFKLTTNGCYQSYAVPRQKFGIDAARGINFFNKTTALSDNSLQVAGGGSTNTGAVAVTGAYSQFSVDNARTMNTSDNEARPATVSLNMQIKAIGVSISTGEAYDSEVDDSGWLPIPAAGGEYIYTHGLGVERGSLFITAQVRNGAGEQSDFIEHLYSTQLFGEVIKPNDINSIKVQIGDGGPRGVNESGNTFAPTEFRLYFAKPSLFAVTKTSSLVSVTTAQEVSIETVEKTVVIPNTVTVAFNITLKAGAGINEENGIWIKNKSLVTIPVLYSSQTFNLGPKGKARFYLDGTSLVWENPRMGENQTWEDVKAARSSGVTYTNITGNPIHVSVCMNSVSGAMSAIVDGVTVYSIATTLTGTNASFIVPNGSSYSVTTAYGIASWAELR